MMSCSTDRAPAQACGCCLPRRGFLKTLAGAAAATIGAAGYGAASAQAAPRRIDVHHHFLSPAFDDNAKTRNIFPPQLKGLSLQVSLDAMDRNGIQTAVLSMPSPGVWFNDVPLARQLARENNDFADRARSDFKGRFGQFATLPLPDVDGTLVEIAYALDVLKTDGVHMWTNYGDKWLGHPTFTPVLEELNRRKAIVYVHPQAANCCNNLLPEAPAPMIEFGTDTTRTIASLVLSGSTNRFPDIKWIFSHAGGTMPFLVERFLFQADVQSRNPEGARKIPNGVLYELKRLNYELAQSANVYALSALKQLVPTSQILLGTDFPYRRCDEQVQGLIDAKMFSEAELQAVGRGNAARLLSMPA